MYICVYIDIYIEREVRVTQVYGRGSGGGCFASRIERGICCLAYGKLVLITCYYICIFVYMYEHRYI